MKKLIQATGTYKLSELNAFLIYLFIIFFLIGSLVTYLNVEDVKNERDSYYAELSSACSKIFNSLEQSLTSTANTCSTIFSQRWYVHFRNVANIFESEFDVLRRHEISQSLAVLSAATGYISDILVITPACDSIISGNGWFSLKSYAMIYGAVSINNNGISEIPGVILQNSDYCSIILNDINARRDKSVICLLINKRDFARFVGPIVRENITGISITLNGQNLYSSGAYSESDVIHELSSSSIDMKVSLYSQPYENVHIGYQNSRYALSMLILLIVSIALAYLFSRIGSRSIRRILNKITGDKHIPKDGPYHYISEYLDNVSHHSKQIDMENVSLHNSIEHFLTGLKREILFGMLTNPAFNYQDVYICGNIPWINDRMPYMIVLIRIRDGESGITYPDFSVLAEFSQHYIQLDLFDSDKCLVMWFGNNDIASEQLPVIIAKLKMLAGYSCFFTISPILHAPEEMREAYSVLRTNLFELHQVNQSLPIALQLKIINLLQTNKQGKCFEELNSFRGRYDPNLFIRLFTHLANDYHINISETLSSYSIHQNDNSLNEQWNTVISLASDICKAISKASHTNLNELADLICRYINANFCNPDMCVNLLAERFSIHRSIVSRLIKLQTGVSFIDYLLDLRMKKALDLLKYSEISISLIAEAVGYISYNSFKRAFQRYQGISPREYRLTMGKA